MPASKYIPSNFHVFKTVFPKEEWHAIACMWIEVREQLIFFYRVGCVNQTQVFRLGSKCLYSVNYCTGTLMCTRVIIHYERLLGTVL